ncbi:C-C motif chemokine 13 [Channa argus]|uniref:C-C motif chemokine 13 n=1 Tax=Channa argus TaxID=215402 RepID=A0A6G1PGG6_CHAAH|nr:C-C motif chemokine 13 [Channa argus]KAK2918264.1 hypothetical protein Q8A73_005010 [Channa argus]
MAAPRLALSVFVLMLAVVALSEALRGTGPKKCCFKFNETPVSKEKLVGYTMTSQRCNRSAVLLKTKAGRELCVKPSAAWVKEVMTYLDNKTLPGETSNI